MRGRSDSNLNYNPAYCDDHVAFKQRLQTNQSLRGSRPDGLSLKVASLAVALMDKVPALYTPKHTLHLNEAYLAEAKTANQQNQSSLNAPPD
jgi:hypothetical protein